MASALPNALSDSGTGDEIRTRKITKDLGDFKSHVYCQYHHTRI